MIVLGLTGSIGMGKSATAALFAAAGDPVHDADHAVHALYAVGGAAVPAVEALFPGTTAEGAVDRARLAARVMGDPDALARLEAVVHPLVRAAEADFLAAHAAAPLVVLDVPLLFETGRDRDVDAVLVVTAPADVQRARVLARPGMTEERFATILAKQMPDADKRRRAHFVLDTGHGNEAARDAVAAIRRAVLGLTRGGLRKAVVCRLAGRSSG